MRHFFYSTKYLKPLAVINILADEKTENIPQPIPQKHEETVLDFPAISPLTSDLHKSSLAPNMTTPKPARPCCKLPGNHSSCTLFKCCFVIISFSCCIDDICQLLQIKQYMQYSCCMFSHNVKTDCMLGVHWQRCSTFKAKNTQAATRSLSTRLPGLLQSKPPNLRSKDVFAFTSACNRWACWCSQLNKLKVSGQVRPKQRFPYKYQELVQPSGYFGQFLSHAQLKYSQPACEL